MILFDRKLYRTAIVYFDEQPDLLGVDVVRRLEAKAPPTLGRWEESRTILIDLSNSPEALLGAMRKDTRYEIRRATDKDRISYQPQDARDPAVLRRFIDDYSRFAIGKGLPPPLPRLLSGYALAGALDLSRVRAADGRHLVWHAYFRAPERVRLLHSASILHDTDDKELRSLIGRANRFHHWQDMLRFKAASVRWYDLGGWATASGDEEKLRVSHFKESFGGDIVCNYNHAYGRTWRGRAVVGLEQLYLRMKNRQSPG